ncbi:MAG: response regulator [Verrucomicrobia bacterium]|jgi:DNA-binding NtrC family response regulator|nr:response regulator [Verrucomicrobiota bacterium]MBT7701184.1 response regulator [Verrucomicrobiota bacterium]
MILVVDDDPRVVDTLTIWLKGAGYEVETASDGGLAYDAVRSPECECMVLDINMPNFNGPSLLLILQAEGTHVPVIVITGETGFSREEMQQFENVVAFFEKPVDAGVFMEAVKRTRSSERGSRKERHEKGQP